MGKVIVGQEQISVDLRPAGFGMPAESASRVKPGVCLPWEEQERRLPEITGDRELIREASVAYALQGVRERIET